MTETKKLLPLGSIVLLEEGLQKLVVVGRGAVYEDQETGEDTFADYMGVLYPTGMNPETTIFFQHDNIDKVVFTGYSDEEEDRFLEIYKVWQLEALKDIEANNRKALEYDDSKNNEMTTHSENDTQIINPEDLSEEEDLFAAIRDLED